jgi:hypothetical protein
VAFDPFDFQHTVNPEARTAITAMATATTSDMATIQTLLAMVMAMALAPRLSAIVPWRFGPSLPRSAGLLPVGLERQR